MEIETEGICYVLPQVNAVHPITYQRHEVVWYPERGMTLFDQIKYRPYVKSVVTESPWIIACYDRHSVRVWDEGQWRKSPQQTYGASVDHIMFTLLGVGQSIPSTPYDGGEAMDKLIKELEESYR